jgi:tetratricopeptide (TPR) repeat protein
LNPILPAKNEMIWLVKSGERILGPFSADHIEERLRSRELVVIDEIKKSKGRWKYLRDEAYFAVIVERLRTAKQLKAEDTEHGASGTRSMTGTEDVGREQSKTFELENQNRESPHSSFIQDAEFVDIKDQNAPALETKSSISEKQFGLTGNAKVQKNIKKSSSAFWLFTLIFIGMALTITYKLQNKPAQTSQGPDFAKTYDLALQSYRQGAFAESLRYFKQAASLHPSDPDVIISMSPLILSIEGQKLEVKRKLGEVLAVVHSEDQVKQAKNILGLVAIAEEDFTEANKQFSDVLRLDSKFIPGLFNMGIVHFLQKDYAGAQADFTKVLVEDPTNSAAIFLLIKSKSIEKIVGSFTNFTDEHQALKEFTDHFSDLKQEAYVLDAYLFSKEENGPRHQQQVHQAIEADPFLSEEFIRDPVYSMNQLSWIYLEPYCEEMSKKFSRLPEMKALEAICLVKTGRAQDAPKFIEEALAPNPYDSLLLSVKAYSLISAGRLDEAHATLILAQKTAPDRLSKILMGRVCLKSKDDTCVKENFEALADSESTPPIAAAGLGEIAIRANNMNSAKIFRDQLKKHTTNYIPLLHLESEIGE